MRINASTTGMAGKYAQRPLVNESLMREIGTLALSMIRRRTQAGIDVAGAAFRPLSPGYAKQKQKALGSARADLSVSGGMLNGMQITASSRNRVTLGFLGGTVGGGSQANGGTFIQRSRSVPAGDKATFHHVEGAGRSRVKRKFFGLTSGEVDTIRAKVQAYVTRRGQ